MSTRFIMLAIFILMSQCRGFSIQDMFPEVVLNSYHEFTNALAKLNPTYTGMWVLKSIFGIPQLVLDSVEVTVSYIAWHGMVWLETKVLASPKMKEALNESNDYWKVLFAVNHLLEFGDAIKFMDRWLPLIKTRDPKIFLKDFIDMTLCTPVGDYDDLLQIFDTIGLERAGKLKKLKEFSEIKKDMILDDNLFILFLNWRCQIENSTAMMEAMMELPKYRKVLEDIAPYFITNMPKNYYPRANYLLSFYVKPLYKSVNKTRMCVSSRKRCQAYKSFKDLVTTHRFYLLKSCGLGIKELGKNLIKSENWWRFLHQVSVRKVLSRKYQKALNSVFPFIDKTWRIPSLIGVAFSDWRLFHMLEIDKIEDY